MSSPYEVLGVSPTASADEIQKAYRKLAKTLHPDLNPGDRTAEDKFKAVAGAYDLLRDPEKRRRFDAGEIDETGAERPPQGYYRDYASNDYGRYANSGGFADFDEDLFADLFRQRGRAQPNRRGEDLQFRLGLTLAQAITGGEQRLTLPGGGTLDVKIPAGIVDGQTLRLKGKGGMGFGSGGPGDAYIMLEVLPDPRFAREGDDLVLEVPISLSEAVLGGKIQVATPTGQVSMTVPSGSNSGSTLRLKGQGAPRAGGGRGDELVRLKIVLPKPTDPELEAFVKSWEAGRAHNPRETSR